MGLGGGFVMTLYEKSTGDVKVLNARERAPNAATKDMFVGNLIAASQGGLAVAVPGELLGYWELHQKYGILEWSDLIQPTIELCRAGHTVTRYLAGVFQETSRTILENESLK